MVLDDPRPVIKWLLQPANQRHLRVLKTLSAGDFQARELRERVEIDHDEQVYRSLEYLHERGLVSQFRDFSGERQGAIYEISPIGDRILEVVHEVEELIDGRSTPRGEAVVWARGGDTVVHFDRGSTHHTEVHSVSQGSKDDTVTVPA